MNRRRSLAVLGVAAAFALASHPASAEGDLVSGSAASSEIKISDIKASSDGSVSATVKNATDATMKDIKVLVTHTWYWKSERKPGEDNPGRSSYGSVPGEIPPGGSVAFEYHPSPPLPARDDGTFETTVEVQSFTRVGGS